MSDASTAFAELDEDVFHELLRLYGIYGRQAEKCANAKAYLMGCVALISALEAMLLCMVHLYPKDVVGASALPRSKGDVLPVLRWKLAHLVAVAREVGWLPAGLQLTDSWNATKARIGDHVVVLRDLRNLVHPAVYVREHRKKHVTAKYLSSAFDIVQIALRHLGARAERSIFGEAKKGEEVRAEG